MWISKNDKRQLQKYYRSIGKPKKFTLELFAMLVALLLSRKEIQNSSIIVLLDMEYLGIENMNNIRGYILKTLNKLGKNSLNYRIHFGYVGKKSKAHIYAYKQFTNKVKDQGNQIKMDFLTTILPIKND